MTVGFALGGSTRVAAGAALLALSNGCAVREAVIRRQASELTKAGKEILAQKNLDAAEPKLLALIEALNSLLNNYPDSEELLLAASQATLLHAHGFLVPRAEAAADESVEKSFGQRRDAVASFSRAEALARRALHRRYPQFSAVDPGVPQTGSHGLDRADTGMVYAIAAAWGGRLAATDDPVQRGAEFPEFLRWVELGLALDPTYEHGAFHELMIPASAADPSASDPTFSRAARHFEEAERLSRGTSAAAKIAYAEAVLVRRQDREGFLRLLDEALVIEEGMAPQLLLEISRERARRLKENVDDLFY